MRFEVDTGAGTVEISPKGEIGLLGSLRLDDLEDAVKELVQVIGMIKRENAIG